jgi:hypothetical protein
MMLEVARVLVFLAAILLLVAVAAWKYDLLHSINPTWRDLAEDFGFPPLPLK